MATIGTFTTDRDGFLKGQIRTLNLDASVSMEPVTSDKEGAPAYRLFAGDVEPGAAWAKTARESGRLYHQVRLDDPSFAAPVFANLIKDVETGSYPDLEPAEAPRQAPARRFEPEPPLSGPPQPRSTRAELLSFRAVSHRDDRGSVAAHEQRRRGGERQDARHRR